MIAILKYLILDVLKFFILYAVFAIVVEKLSANVPKSWDPVGVGMLAMILLFIGFVIGAFRIGASYSDNLVEQEPGTVWRVLKRPIRSVKYGVISLVLSFGLLYLTLLVSSYFMN